MTSFEVSASAGTLRSTDSAAQQFPHRWTPDGVTVETDFSGAHLLHLAVAGCVLNDIYREAAASGLQIDGVMVRAAGEFDRATWASTGITYSVDLRSPATEVEIEDLLRRVDRVAEIPRALRHGSPVDRR